MIGAQGVPPNAKHDAYAVWLYKSRRGQPRLGFVTPGVGKNGGLQTGGALPANAAHYKDVLLTLETQSSPKTPGTIILQGPLKGSPDPAERRRTHQLKSSASPSSASSSCLLVARRIMNPPVRE